MISVIQQTISSSYIYPRQFKKRFKRPFNCSLKKNASKLALYLFQRKWFIFMVGMERRFLPPPYGKPFSSDRENVSCTKFYFRLSLLYTAEELIHKLMSPLSTLPVTITE